MYSGLCVSLRSENTFYINVNNCGHLLDNSDKAKAAKILKHTDNFLITLPVIAVCAFELLCYRKLELERENLFLKVQ